MSRCDSEPEPVLAGNHTTDVGESTVGGHSREAIGIHRERSTKRVKREEGQKTADFEGFIKYFETSALFGESVKNVFDEAIHAIIKDKSKYQKDILAGLNQLQHQSTSKGKKGSKGASGPNGEKNCLIY